MLIALKFCLEAYVSMPHVVVLVLLTFFLLSLLLTD